MIVYLQGRVLNRFRFHPLDGAPTTIAVQLVEDVVLAGMTIPAHRTIEVVDDDLATDFDAAATAVTAGQARALVQAGYAFPITADFEALEAAIESW